MATGRGRLVPAQLADLAGIVLGQPPQDPLALRLLQGLPGARDDQPGEAPRGKLPAGGLVEVVDDFSFGTLFGPVRAAGLVARTSTGYAITTAGAYWIHRLQNEYSLSYINRLWGACRRTAWPEEAAL